MSPTNSEIVLRGFDSFNRGDWDAATSNVHPAFVWINDEDTALLMGSPVELHGPEELREWWRGFFGQWEEWRMEPGETVEGEDGRVFLPVQFTGRGKGSGVPIEFDFFNVWEIRDGMPARITNIRDRDAALAAAGLMDQSSQE
jgi:ketosteroid isomerase-like protein